MQSDILGISIGNQKSYVAAGLAGGIEILLNEYSGRSTPSMVALTDHSRSLGVDASSNLFMNLENTVYDLMVLIGKTYQELPPEVKDQDKPRYPFKIEEGPDSQVRVLVKHLGEERKFSITQVLAMLFTKLRGIAHDATDCVISFPQFFNESQKVALVQAAKIAGLKPLHLISDMSAVVLTYTYYRTTKEDTDKYIAFVDFGQSNLQTVIAWLSPGEDVVRILASESESVGGRDFDRILAEHFIKEQNLNLSGKQYLKLVSACEKLKTNLSVNTIEMPINIESLISEDKDFNGRIGRAKFEEISQPILQRVEECLERTILNANKAAETEFELQAVEIVGGSTRVPSVKQLINKVFQLVASTTLNTDEAVARGCALHCATQNPGTKVKREVKILDSESFFETANVSVANELRRIELELVKTDIKYRSRTEARNNLEEFIYLERAKFKEGDEALELLNSTLDWLLSDEGDEAAENEYNDRLSELKKLAGLSLIQDSTPAPPDNTPIAADTPPDNNHTTSAADGITPDSADITPDVADMVPEGVTN